MADFYPGMRTVAYDLIDRFGQAMVVIHREEGAYDPDTGTTPIVETQSNRIGVVRSIADTQRPPAVVGTVREVVLACSAGDDPPEIGDMLTVGGGSDEWKIGSVTPVNPGGTVLVYRLTVER